jgi:hypothetical protein
MPWLAGQLAGSRDYEKIRIDMVRASAVRGAGSPVRRQRYGADEPGLPPHELLIGCRAIEPFY